MKNNVLYYKNINEKEVDVYKYLKLVPNNTIRFTDSNGMFISEINNYADYESTDNYIVFNDSYINFIKIIDKFNIIDMYTCISMFQVCGLLDYTNIINYAHNKNCNGKSILKMIFRSYPSLHLRVYKLNKKNMTKININHILELKNKYKFVKKYVEKMCNNYIFILYFF